CSAERFNRIEDEVSASIAPEICVEVKSSSNTSVSFKCQLYLEAQASEVWLCNEQGKISFYNQSGPLEKSLLVPDFPAQIQR
ncbi:MAG: Uma2 family endonuclease, partial [Synechocystis sp.]|nr:Uma2 family endonuclease [Synechocystis sp.]